MQIVNKKVEELKPYVNNPRFNDDAVEYVANSIKEFGFKVPIIIDRIIKWCLLNIFNLRK